jgi:hypothetical protein
MRARVTEGDDYFDYHVNVPAPEYHELSQPIGKSEFAIPVGT